MNLVQRQRFYLLESIRRSPFWFFLIYKLFRKHRHLILNENTEIVIEGYPRSANTFAVVAFEYAQRRKVNIAHHLHSPAQIIRGVNKGMPVCLLIRDPKASIKSLCVRNPFFPVSMALESYIGFYETVMPYLHGCYIAKFDDVISDFGKVIQGINKKFGKNFDCAEYNEKSIGEIYVRIDTINSKDPEMRGEIRGVARPHVSKSVNNANGQLDFDTSDFKRAVDVYNKVLSYSLPGNS